jgi:transcription initiation factor IIF auxiliary subunit
MKIAQSEHYEGQDWWRWSVWIDARLDELNEVEKVIWHLHPTFPEPDREHKNREEKFKLETAGWGTFRVVADVVMKDGRKAKLQHELELRYPDGKPTQD